MHESTRLLRDLVALPSVNPMGRALQGPEYFEHRVTDYLEAFFRSLGVRTERQRVAPLRDNIIAYADLPGAQRSVMFEAHQDTVPTDNMTIAPFEPRIEDGRLYGRGSCDIKGGMSAMLAAFARLVREKPAGAASPVLACTVDEEHTFTGVRALAALRVPVAAAIVAEPTNLDIVNAHKGVVRWHVRTAGRAAHSSRPEAGINAIYRMGRLLLGIEQYAEWLRRSHTDPLLGPPTLSVGRIEGGTSVNTVPDSCTIEVDRRVVPGEDPLEAPRQLAEFLERQLHIEFPFECAEPWMSKVALGPDGSEKLVLQLGRAIDAVRGSHRVCPVPYGTDASTLAEAGIPSVVFGPGDIGQAHTRDESVPLDEVEQASEILHRFACAFGG